MTTSHKTFSWLCACCLCMSLAVGHSARAQGATQQQLQTLIPDQQDLQGFTRVRPLGEFTNPDGSSRAGVIEDQVIVDGREDEYHPGWVTIPATAAGLLISSTTKNQIVAGMVTFAVFLLLWVISWIGQSFGPTGQAVVSHLAIPEHLDDFARGIIDTKHLVYYLSFIVFGLFLTARSVDSERWRG